MSRRAQAFARRIGAPRGSNGGLAFGKAQAKNLKLYGLTNFSAANYMATASGGGEAGVSTGFGIATLFQCPPLSQLVGNLSVAERASGVAGYVEYFSNTILATSVVNGAAGFVGGPQRTFTASDVGKVFLHIVQHTGAGGVLRAYCDRVELGAGAAISGYTPANAPLLMSRSAIFGAAAVSPAPLLAHAAWRGVPSLAQIQAFFDATRARGDLPDSMDGATVTHRWSAKDELLGVSNPAGRKTYGARGFATANYLETAAGKGVRGAVGGFWVGWYGTLEALAGTSQTLTAASNNGGDGWQLFTASGNTVLSFGVRTSVSGTPTTFTASSAAIVTAADLNRPALIIAQLDAANVLHVYWKGVEVATIAATGTTAFLAATVGHCVGTRGDRAIPAVSCSWMGTMGGHYAITLAEAKAAQDASEQTGRMVAIPGKTEHSWDPNLDLVSEAAGVPSPVVDRGTLADGTHNLTKTGTLELAISVATAPPAPAQLTDTTTRVTADALLRVGSPSVRIIDPTIDGRRTLGAQGFSATNLLVGASTAAGITGSASGFWVAAVIRHSAALGATAETIVAHSNANTNGWSIQWNGTLIRGSYPGVSAQGVAPTANDVGVMRLVVFNCIGAGASHTIHYGSPDRLATQGVATMLPSTGVQAIGALAGGTQPAPSFQVFGVVGGNVAGGLTLAQVQQAFDEFEKTGLTPTMLGLAQHRYDLTTDILASGVDAVPAQVLDRVGTDHLTRVGIDVRTDANSIRAVGPYSAGDAWQTAPGGGVQGSTSGMHAVLDVWLTKIPTTAETWVGALQASFSGWILQTSAAALRLVVFVSGVNTNSGVYTITAPDLGKRLRITVQDTGPGGFLRLYVNGVQAGADVARPTYVVPTATPFALGQYAGAQGFTSGYIEAFEGGNTVLTLGEIATVNADLTLPPPVIAGKTLKRYVFEQDIAAVSGALPSKSVERVSGNDDAVRYGSPLVLAQRTERVWSYETSPIHNGFILPATQVESFEAANVQIGNTTTSWWFTAIVDHLVAGAGGKRFVHRSSGAQGFLGLSVSGTTYQLQAANGAAMTAAPTLTLAAADLGKIGVLTLVWDATTQKLRSFYKRVEVGTGTAFANGYTPDTGVLCWGQQRAGAGSPQSDAYQLGLCGGNFLPTVAELQAQYDAILAKDGLIQAIPGKTSHLWNGRRLSGVSAFVAGVTSIPDEIGTAHMVMSNYGYTTTGFARADLYARAFAA